MTDTTSIKHPTPLTSGDFTAAEEPFALFGDWFAEAVKAEPNDPNAMALATVDADGLPDVRMVLMKGYDANGFVFYSHIASQKGANSPQIQGGFTFHWSLRRRSASGGASPVTALPTPISAPRKRRSALGCKQSQPLESCFARAGDRGGGQALSARCRAAGLSGSASSRAVRYTTGRSGCDRIEFDRAAPGQPWSKTRLYP
jgi:pyridoxamine 5'-phosphate oxidase